MHCVKKVKYQNLCQQHGKKKKKKMMMTHKASHGKQMAQHLHPYYPIPTIHNFPIEQLHQMNLNPAEWEIYMKEEIENAEHKSTFEKQKVIGFVPRALFEVKPQSYCPRILTIGPLYQNLLPSPMDRCKAICVKKFMERYHISNVGEIMKELIPDPHELSNIYFGLPTYNFESLRLLVTVDTIFIHEFLLFLSEDCPDSEEKESGYLYTFINNGITRSQIWRDLLLIGNQIPMSFLRKIINMPKKSPSLGQNELPKWLSYFVSMNDPFLLSKFPVKSNETDQKSKQRNVNFLDCEHLLDCLYLSCIQKESPEHSRKLQKHSTNQWTCLQLPNIRRGCKNMKNLMLDCLRTTTSGSSKFCTWLNQGCKTRKKKKHGDRLETASELSKSGIQFKACEGNISVIKYHKTKSQLDLPRLVVYDGTEDKLRNILAHEQTCKEDQKRGMVCGYAMIMDSLINTQEDIAILTRAKVLENHLGSDERLVQMWNEMCINIWEGSYPDEFKSMIKDIMEHCRIHWRVLYVEFCAKFCSRPWLLMSAMAAVILLIFALLQTIFTILR